jgi:hypothetical protein
MASHPEENPMAMKVGNQLGISLPLAVWLLHDEYDYVDKPNYISVTGLMKSLRQIILPSRIPPSEVQSDVSEFIARKLGHAIHDSIEQAWLRGYRRSMKLLGYPDDVIERIAVNPTDEERQASNEMIPVYLEQRMFREITIDGVTHLIGGKFDMVADGIVNDAKSCSAWSWAKGTNDTKHSEQMSLYRWLDAAQPLRKIDQDFGTINYIFTDWSKAMLKSPNYPQKRVESKNIPLKSLAETEAWVIAKLRQVAKYKDAPESELPECTDEELWRSDPVFKYYSDPAKALDPTARATKNFDSLSEANKFLAEKGKGIVITKLGEPKACGYCAAFDACTQKDKYL